MLGSQPQEVWLELVDVPVSVCSVAVESLPGLKLSSVSAVLGSALEAVELEQLMLSTLSSAKPEWSVINTLMDSWASPIVPSI